MSQNKKWLISIFLVALAVRCVYVFWVLRHEPGVNYDSLQYDRIAENVAAGKGFRLEPDLLAEEVRGGEFKEDLRSYRAPGYPFFLAGIYAVFGHSYTAVKFIQVVLSALTCALVFLMGLAVSEEPWIARLSGIISCFYYGLFHQPSQVMTETLFTFLFCGAVLLFLNARARPGRYAAGAVTLGLATLVRPTSMLFPFFACLWILIREPLKPALKTCGIVVLCFILTLSPWVIRNYHIHGHFFLNSDFGLVFWFSNNPYNVKGQGAQMTQYVDLSKYSDLPEYERNQAYVREGLQYLKSQPPAAFLKTSLLKIGSLVYPFLPGFDATFVFMAPFWLLGMVLCLKSGDRNGLLAVLIILMFFAGAVITSGAPRFRWPMSPFIILLGSAGLMRFVDRRQKRAILAISLWAILNAAVYFYSEPVRAAVKRLMLT